jgi:hypothetical protein
MTGPPLVYEGRSDVCWVFGLTGRRSSSFAWPFVEPAWRTSSHDPSAPRSCRVFAPAIRYWNSAFGGLFSPRAFAFASTTGHRGSILRFRRGTLPSSSIRVFGTSARATASFPRHGPIGGSRSSARIARGTSELLEFSRRAGGWCSAFGSTTSDTTVLIKRWRQSLPRRRGAQSPGKAFGYVDL